MNPGSGSPPPDPPGFGPGSPGYGPGAQPPPPSGPQSPAPAGPQSPAPTSPGGPQSPAPPPPPPHAPPVPPGQIPAAPSYGGPVPPGGWQQSLTSEPGGLPRAPLASWGSRLGAYVIDGLVVFVPVTFVFFLAFGGAFSGSDDESVAVGAVLAVVGWILLLGIASLLYAPLLMMRGGERNGQTWGKQVVGIRAVRDSGEPWGFWSAALREVVLKNLAVLVASSIIPIVPWFLNFFWPLWDDQNRALHDMAASSHVVKA